MKKMCHIGLHEYKLAKRDEFNAYYQCEYCSRRTVITGHGGEDKVDLEWLNRTEAQESLASGER